MVNVARDGMKRVQIGGTIAAEIAAKLSLEYNRSDVLENALRDYYAKKENAPPPRRPSDTFSATPAGGKLT